MSHLLTSVPSQSNLYATLFWNIEGGQESLEAGAWILGLAQMAFQAFVQVCHMMTQSRTHTVSIQTRINCCNSSSAERRSAMIATMWRSEVSSLLLESPHQAVQSFFGASLLRTFK